MHDEFFFFYFGNNRKKLFLYDITYPVQYLIGLLKPKLTYNHKHKKNPTDSVCLDSGLVRDAIENILVTRVPFHISIKHKRHGSPLTN